MWKSIAKIRGFRSLRVHIAINKDTEAWTKIFTQLLEGRHVLDFVVRAVVSRHRDVYDPMLHLIWQSLMDELRKQEPPLSIVDEELLKQG